MIIRTTEQLGEAIRARRRELGLTQEALAGVSGVHRVFVSQVEHGKPTVHLELVLRLLQALALDVSLRPRDR